MYTIDEKQRHVGVSGHGEGYVTSPNVPCPSTPIHTVLTSIVAVTLQCVYLCCIIELFQHNTPRLIYFEGLET